MGKWYDHIPEHLFAWIEKQHVFWVAMAPLSPEGHVNISPKGMKATFHIVSPTKVWYEDLTGTGVETISHLRENGRITICFQAFEGPPQICRLFGSGTVHEFGTPEYDALIAPETRRPGSRAAIVIDVHKAGTTCGYAVPYLKYVPERDTLLTWAEGLERHDRNSSSSSSGADDLEHTLKAYWKAENIQSIDGVPGLRVAHLSDKVPEVEANNWAGWKTDRAMVKRVMRGSGEPVLELASKARIKRDDVRMLMVGILIGVFGAVSYSRLSQLVIDYVGRAGLP